MKKSLTGVVALLAGAFVAHSQGTVSFGNYLALTSYIYVELSGTKLGGSSTGPAATQANYAAETGNGNDWTVALYGNGGSGDAASTLTQLTTAGGASVTASLAGGASAGDATPGTWASVAIANVPGTTLAGQAVTLQLYAWYNAGGSLTTYSAAKAGPNSSGPPSTAPALPSGLGNVSLTTSVVPEPSTIALGVMGASAFLMRLRKKQ